MIQVNILEAKTDFSKLIHLLELNKEESITIARNGKPIAKLTLINDKPISNRIGIAKGKFNIYGDFNKDDENIANLLSGGNI